MVLRGRCTHYLDVWNDVPYGVRGAGPRATYWPLSTIAGPLLDGLSGPKATVAAAGSNELSKWGTGIRQHPRGRGV